ncbi:MAG: hypothetical protein HW395_1380, partial [candidate division NC10 bacterium]|nr:hypothetical protein [candidate division NC10 bacterium]
MSTAHVIGAVGIAVLVWTGGPVFGQGPQEAGSRAAAPRPIERLA